MNSLLLLQRRKENNMSRLLSEESIIKCWLLSAQGANMGKDYSLIPNLWDWETHWRQSKKEKKKKKQGASSHLWNIFLALKEKFCICNMLDIYIYIYISILYLMACILGGFLGCNFFPLYINRCNLRTHPAKWLPQLRKTTYMEI